jgi:hypothetical protein
MVMNGCSLIRNDAISGQIAGFYKTDETFGGAIAAFAPISITNCTFALNNAFGATHFGGQAGDAHGGAVFAADRANIAFCTFVSNNAAPGRTSAPGTGFGGALFTSNLVTISGSIFERNSPTNVDGTFDDRGGNIVSDQSLTFSSGTTSIVAEPKLGPIRTVGTTHIFFPPQDDSPALGFAQNIEAPAQDQVGFPRSMPDAGAIEWQGSETKLAVTATNGSVEIRVADPTYSYKLLDQSANLTNWHSMLLESYEPRTFVPVIPYGFFRLR